MWSAKRSRVRPQVSSYNHILFKNIYAMLSPQERQDKIIRATDLDALSSRFSANNKGYFSPPDKYIDCLLQSYLAHLQFCTGYTNLSAGRTVRSVFSEQKLPIINRGTYLRTELIDQIVHGFVEEYLECQIISLGGGSDTRCFRLFEKYPEKKIFYAELDFDESVKIKKLAIVRDRFLQKLVGSELDTSGEITSKEEFSKLDSDLHTDKYHLIGLDLRNLANSDNIQSVIDSLSGHIDFTLPTLVLSECVLCYLTPEENTLILRFWEVAFKNSNKPVAFLIYEPMSLEDAFGKTMAYNLSNRGIDLHTFHKFPNLSSRYEFLTNDLGLQNVKLTDIAEVGGYGSTNEDSQNWIATPDLHRINRLELIDEIEEIQLLFKHYCLCYAEYVQNGSDSFAKINKWKWKDY